MHYKTFRLQKNTGTKHLKKQTKNDIIKYWNIKIKTMPGFEAAHKSEQTLPKTGEKPSYLSDKPKEGPEKEFEREAAKVLARYENEMRQIDLSLSPDEIERRISSVSGKISDDINKHPELIGKLPNKHVFSVPDVLGLENHNAVFLRVGNRIYFRFMHGYAGVMEREKSDPEKQFDQKALAILKKHEMEMMEIDSDMPSKERDMKLVKLTSTINEEINKNKDLIQQLRGTYNYSTDVLMSYLNDYGDHVDVEGDFYRLGTGIVFRFVERMEA